VVGAGVLAGGDVAEGDGVLRGGVVVTVGGRVAGEELGGAVLFAGDVPGVPGRDVRGVPGRLLAGTGIRDGDGAAGNVRGGNGAAGNVRGAR